MFILQLTIPENSEDIEERTMKTQTELIFCWLVKKHQLLLVISLSYNSALKLSDSFKRSLYCLVKSPDMRNVLKDKHQT